MKLELKHLAPYLPYRLKSADHSVKAHGLKKPLISNIDTMNVMKFIDGGTASKPILRPLSDLDNYLRNEFEKLDKGYAYDKIAVDLFCEENGVSELIEHTEINSLPYECVEYMFKNHYDVFGLIEKGLAIDINTI